MVAAFLMMPPASASAPDTHPKTGHLLAQRVAHALLASELLGFLPTDTFT